MLSEHFWNLENWGEIFGEDDGLVFVEGFVCKDDGEKS